MVEIQLTSVEVAVADLVAKLRMDESIKQDRVDRLYDKSYETGLNVHRMGAYGELAAAKALNLYPAFTVGEFRGMRPDLKWNGWPVEVRHRAKHEHDLIIRHGDPKGRMYLLTTGMPPVIRVVGYLPYVSDQDLDQKWIRDYGGYGKPSYFVPKEALTHFTKETHIE